ncbi:MAG: PP2C family serine/threonine-protein phosphatase [Nitrospirota bacterium]
MKTPGLTKEDWRGSPFFYCFAPGSTDLYKTAYYMHMGLRESQEDCLFINGKIFQDRMFREVAFETVPSAAAAFAVCDGMGGRRMGEWASRYVCEKLVEHLKDFELSVEFVGRVLYKIQSRMEKESVNDSGATVAGVALANRKAILFNAGDARVYKLNTEDMTRVSHDHSLLQSNIDQGYLSVDEAASFPFRNIIEFGMGDVFRRQWASGEKKPFVREDLIKDDECYLICSDGVHDVLTDREISAALRDDPFALTAAFVETLKSRMKDNFSFILVAVGS